MALPNRRDREPAAVDRARLLLGVDTSRCNKMHLAAEWGVPWRWQGEGPTKQGVMRSRMLFLIEGQWQLARSFDEDVMNGEHLIKMGAQS